eukprot:Pgem_evm1s4250
MHSDITRWQNGSRIVCRRHLQMWTRLIDAINKQYPLKHLREAQVIIGMEIKQSETHTKIHQQQYIQNVMLKFCKM